MHRVEAGLAGGARPAWPNRCVPHPRSAWAAGLPGQSGLARSPSGLTLLCSTHGLSHPWGSWPSLATPGSLLYIFKTSFYSL